MQASEFQRIVRQVESHIEMLSESGIEYIPYATAGKPATDHSAAPVSQDAWQELRKTVAACTRCGELVRNRHTVVFGSGNEKADLVFVGEAPGYYEDQQGLPFVGRAGELLTKMIQAMGLQRADIFICNVLKCRPPNNRNPLPEEVMNCEPYLTAQLELLTPKVICALGNFAAQALLKTTKTVTYLRGEIYRYKDIPCVVTFHPAYLLRNPLDKRKAWEDLKTVMELLGLKIPK